MLIEIMNRFFISVLFVHHDGLFFIKHAELQGKDTKILMALLKNANVSSFTSEIMQRQ